MLKMIQSIDTVKNKACIFFDQYPIYFRRITPGTGMHTVPMIAKTGCKMNHLEDDGSSSDTLAKGSSDLVRYSASIDQELDAICAPNRIETKSTKCLVLRESTIP